MTYHGRIENGVVVLEPGTELQEGTVVRVEPVSEPQHTEAPEAAKLRQTLLSFAGVIKDAPADLARNHDHYLHGTPRK